VRGQLYALTALAQYYMNSRMAGLRAGLIVMRKSKNLLPLLENKLQAVLFIA
jgi:hypothetical protein